MNVYDFDKTIYNHDSTAQFYLYLLVRNPLLCRYWPKQLYGFAQQKARPKSGCAFACGD